MSFIKTEVIVKETFEVTKTNMTEYLLAKPNKQREMVNELTTKQRKQFRMALQNFATETLVEKMKAEADLRIANNEIAELNLEIKEESLVPLRWVRVNSTDFPTSKQFKDECRELMLEEDSAFHDFQEEIGPSGFPAALYPLHIARQALINLECGPRF